MGLKKQVTTEINTSAVDSGQAKISDLKVSTVDSGTSAAIERLTNGNAKVLDKKINGYKPRDFDAEARGKTRCVQFEAALQSPAIAGMRFKTMEEYLELVKQAAEAGVKFTFGE